MEQKLEPKGNSIRKLIIISLSLSLGNETPKEKLLKGNPPRAHVKKTKL